MNGKYQMYVFTNFNMEIKPEENFKKWKYILYGKETCPKTGRPHHQGMVYFNSQRSFKSVGKEAKGWVNVLKNADASEIYCKKDKDWVELGTRPAQGARNDLEDVKNRIINGESVDDIILENPNVGHMYGRTLDRIEDICLRKKFRCEMTKGIWYHGKTGVGKSHKAFEGFNPSECYVWENDNGWWDGYKGQKIVIMNDFRGEMCYGQLLSLVDKWPKRVKRRGREPVPFLAETLIITSSLKPDAVYNNLAIEDNLAQLLRRFEVIEIK